MKEVLQRDRASRDKASEIPKIVKKAIGDAFYIQSVGFTVETKAKSLNELLHLNLQKNKIVKLIEKNGIDEQGFYNYAQGRWKFYHLDVYLDWLLKTTLGHPVVPDAKIEQSMLSMETIKMRRNVYLSYQINYYDDSGEYIDGGKAGNFSVIFPSQYGAISFKSCYRPGGRYLSLGLDDDIWLRRFKSKQTPTIDQLKQWGREADLCAMAPTSEKINSYTRQF